LNSTLHGDAAPTDRLIVQGNTAGSTNVKVINVGGKGAPTVDGIKIIDVGGTSAGIFTLLGDYVLRGEQVMIAGAYAYTLQKGGVTTPGDGDWYLRSDLIEKTPHVPPGPLYQPGVALYESYPQILLQLMTMPALRDRAGDHYASGGGRAARAAAAPAADDDMSYLGGAPRRVYDEAPAIRDASHVWWGRVDASRVSIEPSVSTAGATYDADQVRLQSGFDALLHANRSGKLMGGFTVQQGMSSAHVQSVWGDGKLHTDGIGIGGTLTWYSNTGFYVDGQAQVNWFDTDIRSSLAGAMRDGEDAVGYGVSIETGKRFAAGGPWALTPQAQLAYTRADFNFMDNFGASISSEDSASLLGRLGLAIDYRIAAGPARSNIYGIANLYYEFLDGTSVDVSGVHFRSEPEQLWGGLGLGGSYSWGADKYALFGEVSFNTGLDQFGDSTSVNGTAGFRIRW
jgi:outer membrane autotransporter protein